MEILQRNFRNGNQTGSVNIVLACLIIPLSIELFSRKTHQQRLLV